MDIGLGKASGIGVEDRVTSTTGGTTPSLNVLSFGSDTKGRDSSAASMSSKLSYDQSARRLDKSAPS